MTTAEADKDMSTDELAELVSEQDEGEARVEGTPEQLDDARERHAACIAAIRDALEQHNCRITIRRRAAVEPVGQLGDRVMVTAESDWIVEPLAPTT